MAALKAKCPVCDGAMTIPADSEESEILTCPECNSRVVVSQVSDNKVKLDKAPEIEEDWGE